MSRPRTSYDEAMAAAYRRGRALRPDELAAWTTAARPHLPTGGRLLDRGAGTGRFSGALAQACGSAAGSSAPSLDELTDRLDGVGLRRVARVAVPRTLARDGAELLAKVRTRSLSPPAGLPDPVFAAGLREPAADVDRLGFPLVEQLDLVVFG